MFRIPPVEFSNKSYDALDVLPNGIRHLHDQLAACPSFCSRVVVVEQFLRNLVAQVSIRSELGQDAAAWIFQVNGVVCVREVARFQTVLDTKLLRPQFTWLSIAHDLDYHDRMHMLHDFHELAGAAPNEMLATIRDARPTAMKNFSQIAA